MVYIYVLRLVKNKYYIGKSFNPYKRIADHYKRKGAIWTKKYKPIETIKIITNCDNYDEDKYTKIYMQKYGIDNVRGGTFTSVNLTDLEIQFIKKSLMTANDKCFTCGNKGHFAKDCPHANSYDQDHEGVKYF